MRLDNSLREAANDSERLAMCRLASMIRDGLRDQAADNVMTTMATTFVECDFNVVTVKLEFFGEYEIVVRKNCKSTD